MKHHRTFDIMDEVIPNTMLNVADHGETTNSANRPSEMEGINGFENSNLSDIRLADSLRRKRLFIHDIVRDNVDAMLLVLDSVRSTDAKRMLITEQLFSHEIEEPKAPSLYDHPFSVCHALSLAVVYGSTRCLSVLLQQPDADPFMTEIHNNNLIHLVTLVADLNNQDNQECALEMFDAILAKVHNIDGRRRLLLSENDEGYRPLELAAKLRVDRVFRAILYTEGVYRSFISRRGRRVMNRFDLSDYGKSCRRFMRFPLYLLTRTPETERDLEATRNILAIPVLKTIMNVRTRAVMPYMIVWVLFRLLYWVLFLVIDNQFANSYQRYCTASYKKGNATSEYFYESGLAQAVSDGGLVYVDTLVSLIFGVFIMATDMIEASWFVYKSKKWKYGDLIPSMSVASSYCVNSNFYRGVQFLHAVNLVFYGIVLTVKNFTPDHVSLNSISYLSALFQRIFVPFTIIYFVQILPYIGSYIVGFQKMLTTLFKFGILQLLIMYLFASFFIHVIQLMCKPTEFTCGDESSFYATFLIMLNMENINKIKCNQVGSVVLPIMHILYIFVVAIMTINYFIAVMSSAYVVFGTREGCSMALHRIHLATTVERRLVAMKKWLPWMDNNRRIESYIQVVTETHQDRKFSKHQIFRDGP